MGLETGINTATTKSPPPLTPPSPESYNQLYHPFKFFLQTPKLVIIFAMVAFACLLLYNSSPSVRFPVYYNPFATITYSGNKPNELKSILKKAAISNKTIIITTLNDAWAEPNSMFDLLLESFRIGNQTERFLNHLVVVALDQKAFARCLKLHPYCYNLSTNGTDFSEEAYFMAADYLQMMWRRIDFLRTILDLGMQT